MSCSGCSSVDVGSSAPAHVTSVPCTEWHASLIADIGSDPKAVSRDFPRMLVFVNAGSHSNYHDYPSSFEATANPILHPRVTFAERFHRVRECVSLIAELCGEESTFGKRFTDVWDSTLSTSVAAEDVDIHSTMQQCIMESGMIEKSSEEEWVVHSKTFCVLLCTVQGTMFYPSLAAQELVRMPWSSHMKDNGWSIHIFSERVNNSHSPDEEGRQRIIVQHQQIASHYVDKKDRRSIPRFDIHYGCTLMLNVDGSVQAVSSSCGKFIECVQLEVLDVRLEEPKCACFLFEWKTKSRELKRKLMPLGIEVTTCKKV